MIATRWDMGAPVAGYRWAPAATPRATVLLGHGVADYAERNGCWRRRFEARAG